MRSDKGIKEAVQLEGHLPILERILAFAYEKNGEIRQSILQWRNVFLASESEPPFTGLRKKCLEKGGNEASQCS